MKIEDVKEFSKAVLCFTASVMLMVIGFSIVFLILQERENSDQLTAHSIQLIDASKADVDGIKSDVDGLMPTVKGSVKQVGSAAANLGSIAGPAKAAFAIVNHPCVPGPCGTLADVAKTLNTARLTMGQVEVAANHEDRNLGTLDAQEAQLFSDTNEDLQQLASTISSANKVIEDPATAEAQHNLALISGNVAGITKDVKVYSDKFVAPQPWWKKALVVGNESVRTAACLWFKVPCTL
jgi:hypothetical protein